MELIARFVKSSELTLKQFFRWPPGFPALALEPSFAGLSLQPAVQPAEEDKKSEGFLWGVPKKRRSAERRWSRKIGAENWHWKLLRPKTNLRICDTCGHHYEAFHLCRNCYDRVQKETEKIRSAAEAQLGDNPEDKGIIVLYKNERMRIDEGTSSKNVIVEMESPRPQWFSSNLLQKSTAGIDDKTKEVTTKTQNLIDQ